MCRVRQSSGDLDAISDGARRQEAPERVRVPVCTVRRALSSTRGGRATLPKSTPGDAGAGENERVRPRQATDDGGGDHRMLSPMLRSCANGCSVAFSHE